MKILLTIIYLIFTTGGIIFMKSGGNSISLKIGSSVDFKIGIITLIGFVLYIFSFILWQKLLTTFDLSYIVPITAGIMQVLILIIGHYIFREVVNIRGIFGTIFIIIGIILITIGRK